MRASTKKSFFILAILVALLSVTLLIFAMPQSSYAHTYDINITLDATSNYATSGGNFAFSNGNDLYITADNKLLKKTSAFVGKLVDIVANDQHVVVLSQSGADNALVAYKYFDKASQQFLTEPTAVEIDYTYLGQSILNEITKLSMVENEFFINNSGYLKQLKFGGSNDFIFLTGNSGALGDYSIVDNFFILKENSKSIVIFQQNGLLYKNIDIDNKNSSTTFFSQSQVLSCDLQGDFIYANCSDGIYKINKSNGASVKLALEANLTLPKGKIDICDIDGKHFAYILDNSQSAIASNSIAIKMYSITSDTIYYLNSFDNTIFKHPDNFDIVSVALLNSATSMFVSPKNKTTIKTFATGDTLLILANSGDYYYTTDGKNNFGYISKNATTLLSNGNVTTFGKNAQVLHNDTKVYKFPYAQSAQVDTIGVFVVLSVNAFVGVNNDACLWQWCKISYKSDDGQIKSGYLPTTDIAPYTNYTPPIVFKQGAIKADKLGQAINIYLLPDASSEIITQMLDGDIVNFAQKFDPNSEWTKLQLQNGEGYAQTKYLQPSGLTGLQIALITVSCIIFVAMTTILVIIYLKKKKAKHPY